MWEIGPSWGDRTIIRARTTHEPLFDVEPCRLHADGHGEVFLTLGFGFVDGHVDAVETRVCSWKYLEQRVWVKVELGSGMG